MRAYFSVLKLRLITGLQYRVAAFAGITTQFFWGFMLIMIYQAFYSNVTQAPPISLSQLITYVWLQQAFLTLIMFWVRDAEIFNLITSGNIAYELCRPSGLYGLWYAKLVAQRLAGGILRCFPILLVAFFLPTQYKMMLPHDFEAFGLFIISLILGLLVLVAISMLVYISVFKTMSPMGSLLTVGVVAEFFGGQIIPVPLMPAWLKNIAYILPFRLTSDLPFRIYSGNIPHNEALTGILMQLLWIFVLIAVGNLTLKRVLSRVVVQGG